MSFKTPKPGPGLVPRQVEVRKIHFDAEKGPLKNLSDQVHFDAEKGPLMKLPAAIREVSAPYVEALRKTEKDHRDKPWLIPNHIPTGRHAAFFTHGGRLFLEIDSHALEQIRQDHVNVWRTVGSALETFGLNHPMVVMVLGSIPAPLIRSVYNHWRPGTLKALWAACPPALHAVAIIVLIELVIIIVRTIEITVKDHLSVAGGVVIELVFPNFQIQSAIYARGGWEEK